jgi:hypothetical protein
MTWPVAERVIVGGWPAANAQLEATCASKTGQTGQTGQRLESAWQFGALSGQKPPSHDPKLARGTALKRNPGLARRASPIDSAQRVPQP